MYFSAFQAARINRKDFFLGNLAVFAVAIIGFLLMSGNSFLQGIGLVVLFFNWAVSLFLTIGRLHDLNHSGWLFFVLVIPLIGFLFALYLFFAKGTSGTNDYACEPV